MKGSSASMRIENLILHLRALTSQAGFLSLLFVATAFADTATFDLNGPSIEVTVKRGDATLPIARVPDLRVGDRLWVHPELPDDQSAHYLLVIAFLRGSTNPPPEDWFTRVDAWSEQIRSEGVTVTIPDGAEQAIIFLAPETTGDFSTLRSAVRGKPSSFVLSQVSSGSTPPAGSIQIHEASLSDATSKTRKP